ncbi:ferredoxin [Dictyobacter aurantiacus]|uniref:Ferredoxin n=1 Tax=Dictyobacter aurantiacus TaxID=1936993 RepID=A0A401ZKS2_9CHLR|nr:ferredoxin [Dictyobacter aurantiacus]GCE07428.1 hypothetical protein KDAU_47570 [Dictyobacter aurantiacus]
MRVIALTQKCIASGSCVLACGQVFTQSESDGTVEILQEHPPLELLQKVRYAAEACPAEVFVIEDEENTSELTVTADDREVEE